MRAPFSYCPHVLRRQKRPSRCWPGHGDGAAILVGGESLGADDESPAGPAGRSRQACSLTDQAVSASTGIAAGGERGCFAAGAVLPSAVRGALLGLAGSAGRLPPAQPGCRNSPPAEAADDHAASTGTQSTGTASTGTPSTGVDSAGRPTRGSGPVRKPATGRVRLREQDRHGGGAHQGARSSPGSWPRVSNCGSGTWPEAVPGQPDAGARGDAAAGVRGPGHRRHAPRSSPWWNRTTVRSRRTSRSARRWSRSAPRWPRARSTPVEALTATARS